ncbi:MAG: S8 family serine peptidase [Thermoanaerobaculales bacterium]|nr:S8 family serine peptidase [Thermoanaerobaculales bacterium]
MNSWKQTFALLIVGSAALFSLHGERVEAGILVVDRGVVEKYPETRILTYLPGGRSLISTQGGSTEALKGTIRPWTVAEAMTSGLKAVLTQKGVERSLPVIIGLAPGANIEEVAAKVVDAGAQVKWLDPDALVPQIGLMLSPDSRDEFLEVLESLHGILVFADLQPGARLLNDRTAWLGQSGLPGITPIFDHGLHGENEVVALMDTGIDPDSCFFSDDETGLPAMNGFEGTTVNTEHRKILAADFWWDQDWPDPGPFDWDNSGHGTHAAGSVAGDAGLVGIHDGYDGMAPAAKLVIQDGGARIDDCGDLPGLGCPMRPLEPMFEQAWAQGARIHSNSWGDEENFTPYNRYTERTADADRFAWDHPQMLVVAAAGNSGSGDDTVASPSTGKNVLSVGAVNEVNGSSLCPASFSSRGWAHDGRIKPDVMAPGTGVFSAATDGRADTQTCSVIGLSGTSMATPTVAGLAALVRQYFVEGWHEAGRKDLGSALEPSAALVKATLIASAVDLATLGCTEVDEIPSRDQGWGLVQLHRALWFEGDDHRLLIWDRLEAFDDEMGSDVYKVSAFAPGPLKVVLVWTDPPSSSLAATNLINDLDLEVIGPDGRRLGNNFAGGVSIFGGEADRLNNVEVIWLPEAEAGTWVIRVLPHFVPVSSQGYAVVVVGAVDPPPIARNAENFGRAGG